ncbi:MAG TPA: Os1348 family NHLP clan protein [Steroidobacteraceae bacterium]|nr:Os1348 family NHLP clan protein [Steroidobacteraceae bacterium]
MPSEGMTRVFERCSSDAGFREQLRSDPAGALAAAGITLTPEELNGLREKVTRFDWTRSAEELVRQARDSY